MSPTPITVAVDVSPLVDPPTGVGQFTLHLLDGLKRHDEVDVRAFAVSARGLAEVRSRVDPTVPLRAIRVPSRAIRHLWSRTDHPALDRWVGPHEVLHANFGVPPTRGVPVSTVHDLTPLHHPELRGPFTTTWMAMVRRAVRRGGWIHTVSEHVRGEVLEHFDIEPERVVTIWNGYDASGGGDARRGRDLVGSDRSIVFLGTLEPRKGLIDLVEAFGPLAEADPDLHLVLVGRQGWNPEPLDDAIAASSHRARILRTGYVDEQTRQDLLASASVLAYPSRYEGFGLPPLEAMDAGVPVVASNAGAIPEVVGDAGLLVDPGDVDALGSALASVLGDASLVERLVARGRVRLEMFSWDRGVDEMVQMYQRMR